jgi:hypothetical protein
MLGRGGDSTEEVASADYQTDLQTCRRNLRNFRSEGVDALGLNAKADRAGHDFAAKLQEDPVVGHLLCCPLFGLSRVAHLETRKTRDRDVLTQLADQARHNLTHGHSVVFDKRLLEEADFFVVFSHPAFDNLVEDFLRFTFGSSTIPGDFFFFLNQLGLNFFLPNADRIGRGYLHSYIVHKLLEIVGPSHEIRFTVDLDQNAKLRSGMDVGAYHSLPSSARGFLTC